MTVSANFLDLFPVRDPLYVVMYPPPYATPTLAQDEKRKILEYLNTPVQETITGSCLYIHIPFCKSICDFCPLVNRFVVKDAIGDERVSSHLMALKKEIELYAATRRVQAMEFSSVYLGGGTPSLLTTEMLIELLDLCRKRFRIAPGAEITVEGSPSSFSEAKLQALSEWGVNRVSMGVQTFVDDVGASLNLPQGRERVGAMVKAARRAGIKRVCGDLIYNLPNQAVAQWADNVSHAIDLNLDLVTIYPLMIVPHTPLGLRYSRGRIQPPVGDKYAEIEAYLIAWDKFVENGYIQDSLIDFSKADARFTYGNSMDYEMSDLLGVGLGSFSKLGRYVLSNLVFQDEYLSSVDRGELPLERGVELDELEEMRAVMAMGIGHAGRVNRERFHEHFDKWPEEIFCNLLQPWLAMRLITVEGPCLRVTREGSVWGANLGKEFYSPRFRPFEIMGIAGTAPYKPFAQDANHPLQSRKDLWGEAGGRK